MYLAGKLSKFDVTDWVGRIPKHQRWWDMYVEGISMELLEGTYRMRVVFAVAFVYLHVFIFIFCIISFGGPFKMILGTLGHYNRSVACGLGLPLLVADFWHIAILLYLCIIILFILKMFF